MNEIGETLEASVSGIYNISELIYKLKNIYRNGGLKIKKSVLTTPMFGSRFSDSLKNK